MKGLQGGEPMQWEITFDLPALLRERDGQEEDVWSETFHQLAARAVIRDLELLAERERDIEHGNGASASRSTIEPWNIPGWKGPHWIKGSNHQPTPTMPTSQCHISTVLEHLQGR